MLDWVALIITALVFFVLTTLIRVVLATRKVLAWAVFIIPVVALLSFLVWVNVLWLSAQPFHNDSATWPNGVAIMSDTVVVLVLILPAIVIGLMYLVAWAWNTINE